MLFFFKKKKAKQDIGDNKCVNVMSLQKKKKE